MNAASQLQYGSRFGDEVKKIASSALTVASTASDAQVASARYARWFRGEAGEPEPMATSVKKFRRVTPDMAVAEVMAATRDNMAILGEDASNLLFPKLPVEHRMRKAIRSSVLPNVPYLGSCKFGEIVTGQNKNAVAVTQIFIANFDGEIDTSAGSMGLFKPRSREFDQMFFGLHLIVDRNGNPLGFNHKLGANGVAFKTKDLTTALYSIASASTGISIAALQQRAATNKGAK